MFRQSDAKLQRWTKSPALVIVSTELAFTSVTATSYSAADRQMTDGDVNGLVDDLGWALPQLTGTSFGAFQSVSKEAPAAGATVSVQRDGSIVVARYQGLTAATGYAGFGRWATLADGTVTAGIVLYDADFDRSANPNRRTLHVHELGHALGYSHVQARVSVMNAVPIQGPMDFDRDAARIAFERMPGSRSPDVDPSSFVAGASVAMHPAVWSPAIP
jgi:hypothetical protein